MHQGISCLHWWDRFSNWRHRVGWGTWLSGSYLRGKHLQKRQRCNVLPYSPSNRWRDFNSFHIGIEAKSTLILGQCRRRKQGSGCSRTPPDGNLAHRPLLHPLQRCFIHDNLSAAIVQQLFFIHLVYHLTLTFPDSEASRVIYFWTILKFWEPIYIILKTTPRRKKCNWRGEACSTFRSQWVGGKIITRWEDYHQVPRWG